MKNIKTLFATAFLLLVCNFSSFAQPQALKWSVVEDYAFTIKGYPIENMMDGNPATTWAGCLDGENDDGTKYYDDSLIYGDGLLGFKIKVEGQKIEYFTIIAGYAKSETTYKNNSIPISIVVYDGRAHANDGGELVFNNGKYAKTIISIDLKRTMEPQTVNLPFSLEKTSTIWFLIDDVVQGAKYNDLCISELSFYGLP
jgi:hypothetical protein